MLGSNASLCGFIMVMRPRGKWITPIASGPLPCLGDGN